MTDADVPAAHNTEFDVVKFKKTQSENGIWYCVDGETDYFDISSKTEPERYWFRTSIAQFRHDLFFGIKEKTAVVVKCDVTLINKPVALDDPVSVLRGKTTADKPLMFTPKQQFQFFVPFSAITTAPQITKTADESLYEWKHRPFTEPALARPMVGGNPFAAPIPPAFRPNWAGTAPDATQYTGTAPDQGHFVGTHS